MKNPWIDLPSEPPYVLESDEIQVQSFNKKKRKQGNPQHLIRLKILPEPFIGNPATAAVVLLNLNPSYKKYKDSMWHRNSFFREIVRKNLLHATMDYPFYPLNPRLSKSPVARWWHERLKWLLDAVKNDQLVASRICVIEWFPYHSKEANLETFQCKPLASQEYSFGLARQALSDPSKVILVLRSYSTWTNSLGTSLRNAIRVRNPQGLWISQRNLGGRNFETVVGAISDQTEAATSSTASSGS